MSEGQILSRGPSRVVTERKAGNTKIQVALISYFKRHGFNILDTTVNQLLTNIMKKTMREETSKSGKDVDGYLGDLKSIKDSIVNAHPDCDLVKELDEHIFELIFLDTKDQTINSLVPDTKVQTINSLQIHLASLKKKNLDHPTPKLNLLISEKKSHIRQLSSIEKQIKELELFISLMLIITIIYDKSVLHLLIAGPLFSYQEGETESHKVRDGIGKERPLFGCNEALLNLETTLQVVDALYQWREIIESGTEITEDDIARVLGHFETSEESKVKTKELIQLCTNGEKFNNFDVKEHLEGGGIKKRKRTQRKKTKREKTKRKKTRRKKTNRKKQKKSKKSVKIGGGIKLTPYVRAQLRNTANIIAGLLSGIIVALTWPASTTGWVTAALVGVLVSVVSWLINAGVHPHPKWQPAAPANRWGGWST